jgi:hypothetical protein
MERAAREVARVLIPHLRVEVRACTRQLRALARIVREEPQALGGEELLLQHEELRLRVHRAGWALASSGVALESDLGRGRHEREALRWMLSTLAGARGAALAPGADALPLVPSTASRSVPLLAAWCGLHASAASELRWRALRHGDGIGFELAPRSRVARAELARRCARLGARSDELRLTESWLELRWSQESGARSPRDA